MIKRNFTELTMEREPISKNRVSPKNDRSRRNLLVLATICCFCLTTFNVSGQIFGIGNPDVPVTLTHPPQLGIKTTKVFFLPAMGDCSEEIVDNLMTMFVANKVEVLDRNNINTILTEQNLTLSGTIDQTTAATIGKLTGASAMINVKIIRCRTESKTTSKQEEQVDYKSKSINLVTVYTATTQTFLRVSIQVTDLNTGRIYAAQTFEYSPSKANRGEGNNQPEAPLDLDVQKIAFNSLSFDVRKMFFTWDETVQLTFFDDKAGGLKIAYQALKAGDKERAFELSKKNIDDCRASSKIKPKVLARAYYNLGMMYFIRNEYAAAIENYREAQKIISDNSFSEAIVSCERAMQLAKDVQKVDVRSEEIEQQLEERKQAEAANMLTNADIISLTKKNLPTSIISSKIRASKCKFDTSEDALVELTTAGVAEEIILLMMEKK
jgi:hypothetical protein